MCTMPALPWVARAAGLALVAALAPACSHEVEVGRAEDGALLVAEGDELLDTLAPDLDAPGYGLTPVLEAQAPFDRIGLRWDAVGPVAIDARFSSDGGATLGEWRAASLTFSEGIANNGAVDLAAADGAGALATHLQLRFLAPVESELSFLAVDAFERRAQGDDSAGADNTQAQALAADVAAPRSAWGARPRHCDATHEPQRLTIHHTETPQNDPLSTPARLRQIQSYHVDVRGWCDVGYHFLVGRDGVAYVGRPEDRVGAHAGGANRDNLGVAFVGNYRNSTLPEPMLAAGARLLRAIADSHGIPLDRAAVKAHRERNQTDCPGQALYGQLGTLLERARNAAPAPPPDVPPGEPAAGQDPYLGLSSGTARIPRAGLANDTLGNALGMSSEPYGTVVSVQGRQWVRGLVSWFGGPEDTGVSSTETGAVTGERLRSLNSPVNASASTIASRPADFYFVAMRWDYTPHGRSFWVNARILVTNPANGRQVVLRPVDWGPNTSTGRIIDVSPQAMTDLGADTDDELLVAFARPDASLGVVTVPAPPPPVDPPSPPPTAARTLPVGTTWQWQLAGALDTSPAVQAFDLDLFDTPATTIADLKARGRHVICYFSAGTYEAWRPDAGSLPSAARGAPLEPPFEEELWLDTRNASVRAVMRSRLDLAVQKGCDAVEPDNVDGFDNSSGFPLTAATQLDFNIFLATQAHARGLGVGLKNDLAQLDALEPYFDWALNEECFAYDECDAYAGNFLAAGKAVLHAEYAAPSQLTSVCAVTRPLGLSTIIKDIGLDAARAACP